MKDILLDDEGNFVAAADGDCAVVSDRNCLLQDIRHLLLTYPGDLWCHPDYGVGLQAYIQAENTEINRIELEIRIKEGLAQDERIDPESITVKVDLRTPEFCRISVRFIPRTEALTGESEVAAQEMGIVVTITQHGVFMEGEYEVQT